MEEVLLQVLAWCSQPPVLSNCLSVIRRGHPVDRQMWWHVRITPVIKVGANFDMLLGLLLTSWII